MQIKNGWLTTVRYVRSPNCDLRPVGARVDLIVIHGISLPPGEFGGPWIDALFSNTLDLSFHPYFGKLQGLRVSAHALIRRTGEVVQYVPFDMRAWHAGKSCFRGQPRCNDYSIGIELEGSDEIPYERMQYTVLAELIQAVRTNYPAITPERIVGHSDIAPGRKTDPGPAFNWYYLWTLLGITFSCPYKG
jgi:AmpD protein